MITQQMFTSDKRQSVSAIFASVWQSNCPLNQNNHKKRIDEIYALDISIQKN